MIKLKLSNRQGFSLIEVLVALAMLSIIMATFFPLLGWLISRSRASIYDAQATLVLQEAMESAYNVMAGNWDDDWEDYPEGIYHPAADVTSTPEVWVLLPGPESGVEARFNRQIEITAVCRDQGNGERNNGACPPTAETRDNNSKMMVATVDWMEGGRVKSLSANLLVVKMKI